eukprot:2087913-Prymnesium_polylepis.1
MRRAHRAPSAPATRRRSYPLPGSPGRAWPRARRPPGRGPSASGGRTPRRSFPSAPASRLSAGARQHRDGEDAAGAFLRVVRRQHLHHAAVQLRVEGVRVVALKVARLALDVLPQRRAGEVA